MCAYLSLIIPAYNEEHRIRYALSKLIPYLKEQDYTSEIVVVNDGSSDATAKVVESFRNDFPDIQVISYPQNKGKGYAVKKGMLAGKGEFRLFMDADLAVPVEYIEKILLLGANYDIVIGSRGLNESIIDNHQAFFRESAAKLFWVLQRIVTGITMIDTQCGFKLFTKDAAETLFPLVTFDCSYFDTELLYIAKKLHMRIGEIGVRWNHDGITRLPIGLSRTADLVMKLFRIKTLHKSVSKAGK